MTPLLLLAGAFQGRIDGRERLRRMRDGQGAECEALGRVAGDNVGSVFPDRLRPSQSSCRRRLGARVLEEEQVVGLFQLNGERDASCGVIRPGSALPRLGAHPGHDSALSVLLDHAQVSTATMYAWLTTSKRRQDLARLLEGPEKENA